MKRKQMQRGIGTAMVCVSLFLACGCTSGQTASSDANATTEAESAVTEQAETLPQTQTAQAQDATKPSAESNTGAGFGDSMGAGFGSVSGDGQPVRYVEGVEVVSGRVETVSGGMVYSPGPGSGYFTINGTIADNSEIAISIHPVSLLRYELSLFAAAEKTVKAEIRLFKKDKHLVSCVQEEMLLQKGTNSIDVCLDTGEGQRCDGTYTLRLYLDDCLVSENEYYA